jgi:hypothetical protein
MKLSVTKKAGPAAPLGTHRAGPRADKFAPCDMAVLKNPQRAQQLVVKQRLLKSGLRERRD